jgi:4-hydroxy-4-methyl-2-oxoglutarate aldolase
MDPTELVSGFRGCAIASVADAVDLICGRRGYLHHSIKPRINDRNIVGPAVTVLEVPTDEVLPPQHALDIMDAFETSSTKPRK